MAYSSRWETLANALKRVVATGINRKEAQKQIANAIADRAIAVRVTIESSAPGRPGEIVEGYHVGLPQQLSATDFDWSRSRPFAPWHTSDVRFGDYIPTWSWTLCSIGLVEVLRTDVSRIWCDPGKDEEHTSSKAAAPPSRRRPLAPAELQRWYEAYVRDWPEGARHPSESEDWTAAKEAFPSHYVTRNSVRTQREKHAPDAWKAPGRRSTRK